ncbi:citron Rho-interacting kinase-like, partial [Stegodyphus dumicola]|uniref:citron Rho-interacting kinase-like n=1 Tax=Stegodyphus dumicola TaxID=202533 RepID=UPI0015AA1030
VNDTLKSTCIEMEEQLKDFEIIVEARRETIAELTKNKGNLEKEIRNLKESLKQAKSSFSEEEKSRDELLTHIKELTSEMESQNALHEAELQTLQDHLQHYKKVASELAEESAQIQKEMSLQNQDAKKYTEKILALETQLYEIKEEAARHITQISSLKASNLKLTQAINDALENQHKAQSNIEDLCNELESEKVNHAHEKVKLKETISQQAKLIDFLQSKTENMEKRKRPHISRLFGKKDSTPANPGQYRDVEKLLETEKSRCRRLQDQLSQARAENMALQREISNLMKTAASNSEIPLSPMSRAVHSALTFSPNYSPNSVDSPVLLSQELASKFTKPPGMKHKIPHRFNETTCMRSIKCCACLDSVHFGRPVAKCRECSIMCHPKCASSLPNTCGLPSGFIQHFRSTIGDSSSENTLDESENKISEGWVKMPKSNKQGWDRRYLKLIGTVLYIFENSEEKDLNRALSTLDFGNNEEKIVVTSAVSATELTYAATSDLPYVLKVEYIPRTTCWPERCLYIMALNFSDKQMWVSVLENLAESSQTEVDGIQKNKLVGKPIWTLKGDKLIEPNCTVIFDENIILMGAAEGLFVLKVINKFTCSLRYRMEGIDCIYQMACNEETGAVLLIH